MAATAEPCPGEYRRVWELDEPVSADENGWIRVPGPCDVVTDLWLEFDDDGEDDPRLRVHNVHFGEGYSSEWPRAMSGHAWRMLAPAPDRTRIHLPAEMLRPGNDENRVRVRRLGFATTARLVAVGGSISVFALPELVPQFEWRTNVESIAAGGIGFRLSLCWSVAPNDTFLFALAREYNGPFVRDPRIVRWALYRNGIVHATVDSPTPDPGTNAYRVRLDEDVDFGGRDTFVMAVDLDREADDMLYVITCVKHKSDYKRNERGGWQSVMPSR